MLMQPRLKGSRARPGRASLWFLLPCAFLFAVVSLGLAFAQPSVLGLAADTDACLAADIRGFPADSPDEASYNLPGGSFVEGVCINVDGDPFAGESASGFLDTVGRYADGCYSHYLGHCLFNAR